MNQRKRYKKLSGRRKVYATDLIISDSYSPVITVYRRDENGNEWNSAYYSDTKPNKNAHIKRARKMQQALWDRIKAAGGDK